MAVPILWHRLDRPGHEAARLSEVETGWELAGTAIFDHLGNPTCLTYSIRTDRAWVTQWAQVSGWIGDGMVDLEIRADRQRGWQINGREIPAAAGCVDIDLNFSPSTNLLPIRRLHLEVGQSAEVRAAWLRFPSLQLEALEQVYQRTNPIVYRYHSKPSGFTAELTVNEDGFVVDYPGVWVEEAV